MKKINKTLPLTKKNKSLSLAQLKEENDDLTIENDRLQNELTESNSAIADLSTRINTALTKLAAFQKDAKTAKEQLAITHASLLETQNELETTKTALAKAQQEALNLQTRLENITADLDYTRQQNTNLKKELHGPSILQNGYNEIYHLITRPSVVVGCVAAILIITQIPITLFTVLIAFSAPLLLLEGLSAFREYLAKNAFATWTSTKMTDDEKIHYTPLFEAGENVENGKNYITAPISSWIPCFLSLSSTAFQAGRESMRIKNEEKATEELRSNYRIIN